MIFKRKTYQAAPEKLSLITNIFNEYIFPSHVRNGANLVGRWATSNGQQISEIWEYPDAQAYMQIQKRIDKDQLFLTGQCLLHELEPFGITCVADDLLTTGSYSIPKQTVSVSGFITNTENEVLLVKTRWREDTWELPGGAVDEGETLDEALQREIREETGVRAALYGITGVYSNASVVSIVFAGGYVEGEPRPSAETKCVEFIKLEPTNVDMYITRPKYKPRVVDAMKGNCTPYEAFKVRPYEVTRRFDSNCFYRN